MRCGPTGGDHPDAAAACAELAANRTLLTGGTRHGLECMIVIANGPSVQVTGTVDGASVNYAPVSACDPGWSKLSLLLTGQTSAGATTTRTARRVG